MGTDPKCHRSRGSRGDRPFRAIRRTSPRPVSRSPRGNTHVAKRSGWVSTRRELRSCCKTPMRDRKLEKSGTRRSPPPVGGSRKTRVVAPERPGWLHANHHGLSRPTTMVVHGQPPWWFTSNHPGISPVSTMTIHHPTYKFFCEPWGQTLVNGCFLVSRKVR